MNGFYDELIRVLYDPVEKAKLEWTTTNINRLNDLKMSDANWNRCSNLMTTDVNVSNQLTQLTQQMVNDGYNMIITRIGTDIRVVNGIIDKVIFNDPATIVLWADGSKTVVKCQPGDVYDKEKGLLLCFVKHVLGDTSRGLNDFLHKWVTE